MQCELSAEARNELAAMAYARWSDAFGKLKEIKTATWESMDEFCPKLDWPMYHAHMLQTAQKEFDLAARLKAEICKYSPLVCGGVFPCVLNKEPERRRTVNHKYWLGNPEEVRKMARRQRRAQAAVEFLQALAIGLLLSSPLIYQIIQQLKAGD